MAGKRAAHICHRLQDAIGVQMVDVDLEAYSGGTLIHKSKIEAFRKDFTQKMKGNMRDRGRVQKQLKNQEKGKAGLAAHMAGGIAIPKEAFIRILTR